MNNSPERKLNQSVPIVKLIDITKRYGEILANDNISLSIKKGEVHVLFGENGAGKSTLANIMYGHKRPDSGQIFINGQGAIIRSPKDAASYNIGMVHQHFMLIAVLT